MGIIALGKSALDALTAYFNHRRETDLDRRIQISRDALRKIALEIDVERSDGSPDATQRADWLLSEYIGEAKHLKYQKTYCGYQQGYQ